MSYELPLGPDATLEEKVVITRALLDSLHGLIERFAREIEERHAAEH